jgi:ABC-type transport system involved in multi-copper enzyme maturation permease subunit
MPALAGWENFYVIIGSSAGALIGLQFVVITLVAEIPVIRDVERAGSAFSTPTVVHFGTALLLSAIVSAPWRGIAVPAVMWGLVGLIGVVYSIIVAQRMRTQTAYKPVFEDWLFHFLLPFAAYAALAASAYVARQHVHGAMFGVGAAALLLLFIGIHNAWDAVTYHVFVRGRGQRRLSGVDE